MSTRFAVVALLALAFPGSAFAHASLVRTLPASGSVVARPPVEVRVVFDDAVRPGPGIEAIRNRGGSVLAGRARIQGERTLVVPLRRGLRDGAYSVRWSIISDDGHLESGVVAFAVGLGQPPPTAALNPEGTSPAPENVAMRWIFYAGLLGAVGIALLALLTRPRDEERVALVLSTAAVLTAFGAAEEAHRIGLETRAGTALGAGFVAAVVVSTLAGAGSIDRRVLRPALVLALGLVAVPSVAGHALDPGLNRVNVAADILHVAGASAWVGALLGLVVLRDAPRRRAAALALGGVLLLGVTGVVRASFEFLHASQLWDTSYGQAMLVKTGVLLAALAAGWLLRARIRRRAGVELVLVAGLVVAVSVLVMLRPGRNAAAAPSQQPLPTELSPPPPPPPPGSVVLAHGVGRLGVVLALERQRVTAIVLSPAGGGLSGLSVRLGGDVAAPCGHGCYRADVAPGRTVDVEVGGLGATERTTFDVPRAARAADELVRRALRRYRALRSVFYIEQLASGPGHAITARWRLEKPQRVSYVIRGGAQGIVIGARRWDRAAPRGAWQASPQTPLPQPAAPWTYASNAHVIADNGKTKTVSFADPTIPAYFTVTLDSRTLLPRVVHMTAAAHFMTDRYLAFNAPRAIFPPR